MTAPTPHVPRAGIVIASWAFGLAIAGAAAGVIDGLWSWARAGQHLPDLGGRLRWLGFLATSHALAGAVAGAIGGALGLAWSRWTRLGDVARFGLAEHRARRERDPGEAVAGLSLVLAGIPCIAAALVITYLALGPLLANRNHAGLVIASAMAATLGALALAVLATFALGRLVELWLRELARDRRLRALSAPAAPLWAALVLVGIGGAVVVWRTWNTLRLLPLRPVVVVLLVLVLAIGAIRPGQLLATRLWRASVRRRLAGIAGAVAVVIGLVFLTGGDEGVVKAAAFHTGLGGPIARTVRAGFDWDGDGYARVLGGGDCDDGDATVYPGAPEVPGDGIDQNCVGGDPKLDRSPEDVRFVGPPPGMPPNANILLLTIDTLRADHVGAYGYQRPTTPTLDAIAAEGTRFANAWAHAPSTRYSMPAILTGRLPLDVYYDMSHPGWPGLSADATTIAEALKPLGLATGAITNYDYFQESRRMNQGFDEYDNQNQRLHRQLGGPAKTRGSSSKEQTDKAIAWIGRHQAQRWFLWVHYYDPHLDYEPHPEVPSFGSDRVALYDGEIRFTDFHLARLVAELRTRGLYDRTVIVFTGDHGEGFGEHGVTEHGYHLYAAQTRVPIVIRVPGVAPRVSTTPAGHVDLLPTFVDLAGGKPAPFMMGQSLVELVAGAPDRDRLVIQQLSYEGNHEMRAAAGARCHVIYNVSPDTSWEAYRVDTDPLEAHDVDSRSGPCAPVRAGLEKWFDGSQVPPGAMEALLPQRPALAKPLGVFLGDEVELLGVELPAQAKGGDAFPVTWTYAAHGPLAGTWKVFAHFEDGKGGRFTGDHAPVRPFGWWRAGQYIRYTTTVGVPRGAAPGRYHLWAGIWKGNQRRQVRAPPGVPVRDNRVDVASIEVVR